MEKIQIGVARFDLKTWNENIKWRRKTNYSGCIYGVDKEIPKKVPYNSDIFVIEMHNTINKIMGIGIIKNIYRCEYRRKIYDNDNYNRIVYIGKKYKSRKELIDKNKNLIEYFESILFKGSRHFKRGHGISIIPLKRFGTIYRDKKRKMTQCSRCGELGHNLRSCKSKVRIRCKDKESSKKMCKYCGKLDKGHICPRFEVNKSKIREIILFFDNLFN